jgi:photosystem II stability/assembly factor-like uncharacterized protein
MSRARRLIAALAFAGAAAFVVRAQPAAVAQSATNVDAAMFRMLAWRHIGPFLAGPATAAAGIPAQPSVFMFGAGSGGLWRTTDFGRTWRPLFDDRPGGRIDSLAIAASTPSVIYVGTGEGLHRSNDAGRTWVALALRDAGTIAEIAIDARDPNRVFVAALGHASGPSRNRGVFRSTDGGRTFDHVLAKDENTGALSVVLDPSSPSHVYATMWQTRRVAGQSGPRSGPGTGLSTSLDGGTTWRPIGRGLPTFEADGLVRLDISLAPSHLQRVFATVDAGSRSGLYRSDDAGETFSRICDDARVFAAGASGPAVTVDPRNAEVVYAGGRAAWRSADGGRTFTPWRHDPGVGRVQRIWINPGNPEIIAVTTERGALVSVNGGETWSSTDNQPTASVSSASTDTAFPYRVCGGQLNGPAVCVASRGNDGSITARDWRTVGGDQAGAVAVDPLDPEVIFGGQVTRYDRRSGQTQDVSPERSTDFRAGPAAPVMFAPADPRTLFFAANSLWKTNTAGLRWTEISPDLSRTAASGRQAPERPAPSPTAPLRRGVISAVAPSSVDSRVIWAGTDDGLVHVTSDGGAVWRNVTPPQLAPWTSIASIEASRFDPNSAYAAVNTEEQDDPRPHLYRTKDRGETWEEITRGLPVRGSVNAIREDAFRRGLLFTATTDTVHVSFDDGVLWQSLRLNLPATTVRDLIVKDSDVVIATGGRGFWILDDISTLRQMTGDVARSDAFLFRPPTAWRWGAGPSSVQIAARDEPSALNPPDGVPISYLLGPGGSGAVTVEIVETATGETIRRFSSADPVDSGVRLATTPGLHRVFWDVRYASPPGLAPKQAESAPLQGTFVLPGTYQVRLTANGRPLRQAVIVRMDPRVKTPIADLAAQFKLARSIDESLRQVSAARADIGRRRTTATGDLAARLQTTAASLDEAVTSLLASFRALQGADARPTPASESAAAAALTRAVAVLEQVRALGE